ncbi:MAG: undecaprenyl-diphosphate phosphatase [Vulcanococcus sp.]
MAALAPSDQIGLLEACWRYLVRGVVQGVTEFLPISSTAHLKVVPVVLGWGDPGVAVTAVIQLGSIVAVIAYFRRDLQQVSAATLLALQQQWRGRVDLQLVALAPLPFWSSAAGLGLAHRVAASGGLLGAVIGPPFADSQRDGASLRALLDLAGDLGCGIDLHLDESSEAPACGLRLLLHQLDRGHPGVPITCSHSSSLGLLKEPVARRLAARMQRHGVAVVALPTTNFWLLGRHQETQAGLRPLAPVRLLQQEGVAVAIGADNVQDPWYPGGDFDPLELLRLTYRASHTPPWQRQGLMPFTTVPSALLNLAWDGVLRSGAPADLVVTTATSWSDCLARPPQRRVLRQGQWLPAPSCESLN